MMYNNVKISRRSLLSLVTLYGFGGCSLSAPYLVKNSRKFFFLTSAKLKNTKLAKFAILIFDLEKDHMEFIPMAHMTHGMYPIDQKNGVWLAIGEQPSKLSSIININSLKVVNVIQSTKNFNFYGHGCLISGERLALVESNRDDSIISIFNKNGKNKIGEINTGDQGTHDLSLTENNNIVAVGFKNYEKKRMSNVCFVDCNSSVVDHRIVTFSKEAKVEHLKISNEFIFAGISNTPESPVETVLAVAKVRDKSFKPLKMPAILRSKIMNRALSIGTNELRREVFITTSGYEEDKVSHLLKWNYETGRFLESRELPNARGILVDNNKGLNKIWVSHGRKISSFDDSFVKNNKTFDFGDFIESFGAHAYFS